MSGVKSIRIEADGTDLTLSVAGRTWINSDGRRNMPSGEIFTGPVEDSAHGRLRCGFPVCRDGRELVGIDLEFEDGKVVAARAPSGRRLSAGHARPRPGARRLGELGLGLNSGIDRFTGSILYDEKIGGTVHLALGQSYPETGGVEPVGPALGPDRRHQNRRPDHGRRPGRDGKRTVAGGLSSAQRTRKSEISDMRLPRIIVKPCHGGVCSAYPAGARALATIASAPRRWPGRR